MMATFRTQFERKRVCFHNTSPSLTRQCFRDECNINNRIRQLASGVYPAPTATPDAFLDVSDVPDYRQCRQMLQDANEAFSALPAAVRKRFGNDPALLMDFLSDRSNLDEARRLGLLVPEPIFDEQTASGEAGKSAQEKGSGAAL